MSVKCNAMNYMLSLFNKPCRDYLVPAIKSRKLGLRRITSRAARDHSNELDVEDKKTSIPIIKCKRTELNFYYGQKFDKFKPILASKGWHHKQAVGDYFVIYPDGDPEQKSQNLDTLGFDKMNLNSQLLQNLAEMYLKYPSEIQKLAWPVLINGKNSVIAAETGCGKTLAYLIPIIEQILQWKTSLVDRRTNEPLALVISPSRDLTSQIGAVAKMLTKNLDIGTRTITGGRTKQLMLNPTVDYVDVLISSFGALSKLTTTGIYKMSSVRHVVLEEADTLLDDSFSEQLQHFLKKIKFSFAGPTENNDLRRHAQLTLVSATMPKTMPEGLEELINTDSLVHLTTEKLHRFLPAVPQKFIRLNMSSRPTEILKIVRTSVAKKHPTIIFCNRIKTSEWLHLFLKEMGINCLSTHGSLSAKMRSNVLTDFRRGVANILVTTDASARGLDTIFVRHVVNYDFPLYTADYIHRCGRTGRLGSHEKCYVTNFVCSEREIDLLQKMEMAIRNADPLPHVNGNITRLIVDKITKERDATEAEVSRISNYTGMF